VGYFCLGVLACRLSFQIPYSRPTILSCFHNLREDIYRDIIEELKSTSGEIELDETILFPYQGDYAALYYTLH